MKKFKINTDKKLFKIIGKVKNIVFAVILAMLVLVLVFTTWARVSGKTPYVMGFAVYRISSGSMEPSLKIGDVILSRECDPLKLEKGYIVTYEGKEGEFEGKTVTHRVEKSAYKDKGKIFLVTKGDDNPSSDSPISTAQVLGKMVGKLDLITIFYNFFITPWGLIAIILLIILAFFNEIVILVQAILGFKQDDKNNLESIIQRYQKEKKELEVIEDQKNIPRRVQRRIAKAKSLKGRFAKRK
jgi:signal peptidase